MEELHNYLINNNFNKISEVDDQTIFEYISAKQITYEKTSLNIKNKKVQIVLNFYSKKEENETTVQLVNVILIIYGSLPNQEECQIILSEGIEQPAAIKKLYYLDDFINCYL